MMSIYYGIFFLAMAFGIVNTLLFAIGERKHEISMMLAIGMHRRSLVLLIMLESLLLGVVALCVGVAMGYLLVTSLGHTGVDLSSFSAGMDWMGISHMLYPFLTPKDIVWSTLCTILVFLFFSFYPAIRAARQTALTGVVG